MPQNAITIENRRFTCLAPGLVRLEFAPGGQFNDRRSLVAYAEQKSLQFAEVKQKDNELRLETGTMTVISRENDRDFFPGNLEIRWQRDGLVQYWRPGDRDHLNLGGTIRSLDMIDRYASLNGVHTADMSSPDTKANESIPELCSSGDLPYYRMSPKGDEKLEIMRNAEGVHKGAIFHPDALPVRTRNHILDQRKFAPGILSRSGYFFLDDSITPVLDADDFPVERNLPGTRDWYFFCYNDDYRQALRDFVTLTGAAPLPPKGMFGIGFSRWPAYDQTEARQILDRFHAEGIPLSLLMLDMEWHKPGWNHWEWNPETYANPHQFIAECHHRNVLVSLNVHPECIPEDDAHFETYRERVDELADIRTSEFHGKKCQAAYVDIADKQQAAAFMDACQTPKMQDGIDFWWLDGTNGRLNGACSQLLSNKLFFENSAGQDKRPALLSRYGGLGSHRYGAYFTGDACSQWEVLKMECEFNIRAGHIGLAYVSHDIGGFSYPEAPLMDPVLYIRWLQFGVFNPILRLHSSPGSGSRQPWDYGKANADIAKRWLEFRNSLVPYIYAHARQHYDTGIPIIRGLFFDHPDDSKAYRYDQFMFGDALLVAPMLTPTDHRRIYLPKGTWFDYTTGERFDGPTEFDRLLKLGDVPLYAKAGAVITRQLVTDNPAAPACDHLLLDIFPGADGNAVLYEDDGRSNDYEHDVDSTAHAVSFELKQESDTVCLTASCGEHVERQKRHITINCRCEEPPAVVEFNDECVPARSISYEKTTGHVKIELGKANLHGMKLNISTE